MTKKNSTIKYEVAKHSAAIHITSDKVSLLQRKIWNVLLANAYDDLLTKDKYQIKIGDLAVALNYNSNDIDLLKDSLSNMQTTLIQWNVLNKDQEVWISSQFLGEVSVEPKKGVITYGWGPELRKKLYNPAMYARISLAIQSRFKSKYSLILYELCLDYFIKKQGKGQTPWIKIEDFKKLMGVEKDKYCRHYKHLNIFVIKKAVTEVNEESDIHVTYEVKKEKRKVVAIRFTITPTQNIKNVLTRLFKEKKHDPYPQDIFPSEEERIMSLRERMIKYFGMTDSQADEIIASLHDLDQIEDILNMVERKIKRNEILNVGAYTFKALKEDYRPRKSFFEIEKEQEAERLRREREKKELKKKQLEELQKEYEEYKNNAINDYIESLKEEEKDDLHKQFISSLEGFTAALVRENGWNSPITQALLKRYILEMVKDQVMTFGEYASHRGLHLSDDT